MRSIATIVQYYGTSNFLDHPRNNFMRHLIYDHSHINIGRMSI